MATIYKWTQVGTVGQAQYRCGHCDNNVGPNQGYRASIPDGRIAYIFICPTCTKPTFVDEAEKQQPPPRLGGQVKGITDAGVQALYDEARDSTAVGAYTGATHLCRKILMNIAVHHGAPPDQSFIAYVDFLEKAGYVPPNGKAWVDQIRKKGNEATHQIAVVTESDASQIVHFTEMLLRFVYEFPSMLKQGPP